MSVGTQIFVKLRWLNQIIRRQNSFWCSQLYSCFLHLENLLILVLKHVIKIRYSSPAPFSTNQYLNKLDCFGNHFLPLKVKIDGIANLWKRDLYIKSSFQKIFEILVSISPYVLLPQYPELSVN